MSNTELIAGYFKAIQTGDMPTLGSLVAADVVWHQPGHNKFSGTHTGAEAVFGMIGGMMQNYRRQRRHGQWLTSSGNHLLFSPT